MAEHTPAGKRLRSERLTLPNLDQHALEAERDRQEVPVLTMASDRHQADRRGAGGLDRQRDGAAIEEIDDRGIAQRTAIEPPILVILIERADGRGGERQ